MAAGRNGTRKSVLQSLQKLGLEGKDAYFDLFLIHWPIPGLFVEAYLELQVLHEEGTIKSLGLSNFNEKDYSSLMAAKGVSIRPIYNQMEVSAKMYRPNLIDFFHQRGMVVIAFKPLGRGEWLLDDTLVTMATDYNVSTAHLLLRWCIQHGMAVVCKSSSSERMRQNRDLLNFEISPEDMQALDKLTTLEAISIRTKHQEKSKVLKI